MFIAILILLYILRILAAIGWKGEAYKETTHHVKVAGAFIWPMFVLAYVFIWNTWASKWIGWPEVTSLKELVVTIFFI